MTDTAYCRLCAEIRPNSDLVTVNKDELSANLNLDYKIYKCFQIQIEKSDKLPKCVCSECCEQVLSTYEFNEKIQRAQTFLSNLFNQSEEGEEIKTEWNNESEDYESNVLVKIEKDSNEELSDNSYKDNDAKSVWSSDSDEPLSARLSSRKKAKRKTRKIKTSKKKIKKDVDLDPTKLELRTRLKQILEEWKNYKWRCNICPSELSSVKELREHYDSEHQKPPQYVCVECEKVYENYDLFKRHVRAHRNKHKYCCEICGKYSYKKTHHDRHIAIHSVVRKFMCSVCGKSFKTQSSLHIHGRIHLPDELKARHECDVCQKRFSSASNLSSHKKIHAANRVKGIKQYTCDQCGNNFTQKANLQYHIISKHTDSVPTHVCSMCPKAFKNVFLLRRHQITHTDIKPYECETCGKKYRKGSDLRIHQRIHTGELPYKCDYCKKCFRMKKFLQVHVRQHTGERPYSCIDCNHHFANSSNYIKHMKAKHGVSSFKNLAKNANMNVAKLLDAQFMANLQKNIQHI